ncbi:uncharacterized protein PHALS_08564 [Plasmopara halstedii]|uniref:Ubiquitin-like domain-containing protein n=1 Tax=Plasmopara halstedii TaxID=4781 RepID=A0A0P1AC72_PLAHL|nr:uncharacterized protein PHALS_08564 [Plasmopara halstedii]CEG38493.1 hypothetical protein PHALS_08564 [Plasmopara halstedii]|eukprot:XP_024574862.1 hypothetical protein PHALS_08564 [Plasmopara halstedii]
MDARAYRSTQDFKQQQFPLIVTPSTTIKDLQRFLVDQWVLSKNLLVKFSLSDHFFTLKGQILRLDGTLDSSYIHNDDTIYLRFVSLGRICDPWAMSTSELRVELKARNAYEVNLQPEELMQRLQNFKMEESRLGRLQQATRKEETERVETIAKESVDLHLHRKQNNMNLTPSEKTVVRPTSFASWPIDPCVNRTVFLSITELERTYHLVPRDVLESALFIFDTERMWVFDKHNTLQKQQFDYHYMCFEQDFLEMLIMKEEAGLIHWFRPQKCFKMLSAFLTAISDPATEGKNYQPLILAKNKWLTLCGNNGWEGKVRCDGRKRDSKHKPKFTQSIARVVSNYCQIVLIM